MNKSESIKGVMTALGLFQSKALKVTKDATNPHFKSKYASLAAILDIIQPILTECKLVFTQVPEESTHLTTMLFHTESGEYIESRYELKAVNATPQGIGSAITYARRYSLTSLLGLNIDDDDDGNAASGNKTEQPARAQQANTTSNGVDLTQWEDILAKLTTVEEIGKFFKQNKKTVEASKQLLDLFGKHKQRVSAK